MSSDDAQRIIGGLEARLDEIAKLAAATRIEQRDDFRRLFERLDHINEFGCAVGRQHGADIAELKKRPERIVGIGAAIAAIGAAIISWMKQ